MASSTASAKAEKVELMLGGMYPAVANTPYATSNQMCMHDWGQQSIVRSPHHVLPNAKQQQTPVRSPYHFQWYWGQQRPVPNPYAYHFQPYLASEYLVHSQSYLRQEFQERPSLFALEPQRRCDGEHQQRSHCPDEHQDQHQHEHHHRPPSHRHLLKHSRGQQFLPFEEALLFARALKLKTQREWHAWCKSGARPATLPAHPEISYDREGWQGYRHWLGSGPVGLFNQQYPYQQRSHCPGEHYHQYPQQGGDPSYATPSSHPGNRTMFQPAPANDAHALEPVRVPSEISSSATIVPLADLPDHGGNRCACSRFHLALESPTATATRSHQICHTTHIVSRRHGGSSLGLVSNPTPPHMVSSTGQHAHGTWLEALGLHPKRQAAQLPRK